MAKLYFRHGTVSSAKTMNLLAVAHNYRSQGKRVLLLKPRLDTRWGQDVILSRSGLEAQADLLVDPDTRLDPGQFEGLDCVLVDEAQFLSPQLIDQLRALTLRPGLPVICYGLRTDFRTRLFDGSRRLLEVADSIEEVKVTCKFCNRKAIFNMRLLNGVPTAQGAQIELGGDDRYVPACAHCYQARLPLDGLAQSASGPEIRPVMALAATTRGLAR
ncbi:MAG: thymidine kinase [Polyangiaceae bacterium]|jgi:thymidine kinase|nr:thymidine kinase [Polyangiaceae bacterium]